VLPASDSFCAPAGGDVGNETLLGDPNTPAAAAGDAGAELLLHAATPAVAATTSTANAARNILVTAPIHRYDGE
jgi:hypothetical protein